MDKNGDGNVDEQELTQWIHYVQTKYIYDDTERQWEDNDLDKDGKITWDEYKQHTYGFLSEEDLNKWVWPKKKILLGKEVSILRWK